MYDCVYIFVTDCIAMATLVFFGSIFFPTDRLRPGYKKNICWMGALSLAVILFHASQADGGHWIPDAINNTLYMVVWDLSMVWLIVLYRASLTRYFYACANAMLLRHSYSRIPQMIIRIGGLMQYKNWVAIAPHLLCIPYCLLVYWLIGRKIKRDERYEPSKSYSLIMILMTVVILPIAMLENTLWEKGQTLYIIFCIGETIYCFLAVILLYFLYQSTVHTVELQAANTILQERHAQERQLRLLIDAMNAQMHDLKHQMNYLEMTLEEKPEYLEELRNQVGSIQNFYQTGNIFLDVILTEKAMQCQKYRIHFECGITCGQEYAFLSLQDLNALFGNLLDNAITYLRTVPQVEKRYLLIRSSKQGEMLKLKIENYCEDTLCWREDGTPCSTKADTKMHGYGTRNIKSIVASYGGNVIFKTEDMLFKVHILFSGSRL